MLSLWASNVPRAIDTRSVLDGRESYRFAFVRVQSDHSSGADAGRHLERLLRPIPMKELYVRDPAEHRDTLAANDLSVRLGYSTDLGTMYQANVEGFLASPEATALAGKVQLIFTSPPFPLLTQKSYGNKEGSEYLEWLEGLAPRLKHLLTADGSIVIEIGNAWERGHPVMSTLPLEALIAFRNAGEYKLAQQFICHNPARLPSPIQWVNIERIRVKDSYTHVWWFGAVEKPKANNRNVRVPYSKSMLKLIETKKYNAGQRSSGFHIGETSFLTDNGGAIPPSVITTPADESELLEGALSVLADPGSVLSYANTRASKEYRQWCAENDVPAHPAPMQDKLVEFFINLTTDTGDLVFDPFGGSNTTGAVAEALGRRWVATEPDGRYIIGSKGRFDTFLKNSQR